MHSLLLPHPNNPSKSNYPVVKQLFPCLQIPSHRPADSGGNIRHDLSPACPRHTACQRIDRSGTIARQPGKNIPAGKRGAMPWPQTGGRFMHYMLSFPLAENSVQLVHMGLVQMIEAFKRAFHILNGFLHKIHLRV